MNLIFRCLCVALLPVTASAQTLPNSARVLETGRKLRDNGQYQDALNAFRQVDPSDTNYHLILQELSVTAFDDSAFSDALAYADTGLARFPDDRVYFHSLRGQAYEAMGQTDAALGCYDRALQEAPYRYQAYFSRGLVYYEQKRFKEAKADFEHCVLIFPTHASAHFFLGIISMQEGNLVPSMLSFMTYLIIKPDGRYNGKIVRLLTEMANVTDDVTKLTAQHEPGPGDNFDAETEIILSKAALDKSYQLKCGLEDPIVRQMQALLEKTDYRPDDKGFWMQYYIPYFKQVYAQGQFNDMVYEMFSGLGIKSVDEYTKHHNADIMVFARSTGDFLARLGATGRLDPAERDTATVKNLFYDDAVEGRGNFTREKDKTILHEGPWTFYYASGTLKSRGAMDPQGMRTGTWTFYHANGRLKEISHYKAGELEDTTRTWFDNGELSEINPWIDSKTEGVYRSFFYNGLPRVVCDYIHDKPSGTQVKYTSEGFLSSRATLRDGDIDGQWIDYYNNGKPSEVTPYVKGKMEGVRKKYAADGTLTEEASFSAGVGNGPWKTYYASGRVHESYTYANGDLDGLYTEYYDNGQVRQTQPYARGKAEGKESDYTEGGRLFEEDTYEKGKIRAVQFYTADGKPGYAAAIKASGGALSYYDSLGTRISEGNYSFRGDKEGIYTYFYPSGKVSGRAVYRGGELDGPRVSYYTNGRLSDSANYVRGDEDGYYAYFWPNGRLRQDGWYATGKRTGPYREYDINGKMTYAAWYVDGDESGFSTYYAPDGRKTKEYRFESGWPVHYTAFDTAGRCIADGVITPGDMDIHMPGEFDHYNHYYLDSTLRDVFFDQTPRMTRFYRVGTADSAYRSWYYGGQTFMEGQYRLGDREGPWKEYYPNGRVKNTYTYRSDDLDGPDTLYNDDGSLREIAHWSAGQEEGAEYNYGDAGKLAFIYYYHHGALTGYSYPGKDGQPVPAIPLPDGCGKVTAYYANGQKSVELTLVDKVTEGPRSFWYSNGSPWIAGQKEGGLQNGIVKTYYPNGHIKAEERYYYDNLQGVCSYYYPSGNLERSAYYVAGEPEGQEKMYDEGGHLKQTKVYYYGVLQAVR
ncbi:MAG TPA: tetratricopeptide repeat protein [Dinghuibacter sp.]|uniref:tetratricopeptide repeat protein n=1 Tax=Dinghuibacter sp. TaxID=2024697 RepID=UPI002CF3AAD1|nr:tetratricopeptide repeat protein [Dinghuibacter sp.]HTJ10779.1 tetratricopeptide repeat protein [Dinghuibacter sp.]